MNIDTQLEKALNKKIKKYRTTGDVDVLRDIADIFEHYDTVSALREHQEWLADNNMIKPI